MGEAVGGVGGARRGACQSIWASGRGLGDGRQGGALGVFGSLPGGRGNLVSIELWCAVGLGGWQLLIAVVQPAPFKCRFSLISSYLSAEANFNASARNGRLGQCVPSSSGCSPNRRSIYVADAS